MIKSMTGFGRHNVTKELWDIRVEAKCVNSKYCDINFRIPKVINLLEIPLRTIIQDKLIRGKVDFFIEIKFHKPIQVPKLNRQLLVSSVHVLEQMRQVGGLNDEIKIAHLLHFPELIEYESTSNLEELERDVKDAVIECLMSIDMMRVQEGEYTAAELTLRLDNLEKYAIIVDKSKDDILIHWVERFQARMAEMKVKGDNDRIIQEASIWAEKADIKEELSRVASHIQQFRTIMENEYPCGKKLDFLCQELYREWNTIASKSGKIDILTAVINAKSEVDSLREQIQNIV